MPQEALSQPPADPVPEQQGTASKQSTPAKHKEPAVLSPDARAKRIKVPSPRTAGSHIYARRQKFTATEEPVPVPAEASVEPEPGMCGVWARDV